MIIFLGSIIPDEIKDKYELYTNCSFPSSSNTHQKSIVSGIRENTEVIVLSSISIGIYPVRSKKSIIKPKRVNKSFQLIKSSNIPIHRLFYNYFSIVEEMDTLKNETIVDAIVAYMPFPIEMTALYRFKKKNKIPIILIVPDLIKHSYNQYGNPVSVFLAKTIRDIQGWYVGLLAKKMDGFVYLASKMRDYVGKDGKYIVQEAIYDIKENFNDDITKRVKCSKTFCFLYCGKINKENGIDRLIQAFMNIRDERIVLYICGDGNMRKTLENRAKKDNRICFLGQLNHKEILELEQSATILVNPRYTYLPNAAYSFPSKLVEYLACGKPVISSRLAGIPMEYDAYLRYIEDDSVEALEKVIRSTINENKRALASEGRRNFEFVKTKKSSSYQGKVLYNFIDSIISGDSKINKAYFKK